LEEKEVVDVPVLRFERMKWLDVWQLRDEKPMKMKEDEIDGKTDN